MEFVIVQTCIVDVQVFDKAPAILVTKLEKTIEETTETKDKNPETIEVRVTKKE